MNRVSNSKSQNLAVETCHGASQQKTPIYRVTEKNPYLCKSKT